MNSKLTEELTAANAEIERLRGLVGDLSDVVGHMKCASKHDFDAQRNLLNRVKQALTAESSQQ